MSCAICFNLYQSKILSSGNGLTPCRWKTSRIIFNPSSVQSWKNRWRKTIPMFRTSVYPSVFSALKLRTFTKKQNSTVSVFQTKDNGIRRQKVLLNPTLVLYFENYASSNMSTKSVRSFQLDLSWLSLYPEATSRKVTLPLGTVICTSFAGS